MFATPHFYLFFFCSFFFLSRTAVSRESGIILRVPYIHSAVFDMWSSIYLDSISNFSCPGFQVMCSFLIPSGTVVRGTMYSVRLLGLPRSGYESTDMVLLHRTECSEGGFSNCLLYAEYGVHVVHRAIHDNLSAWFCQ